MTKNGENLSSIPSIREELERLAKEQREAFDKLPPEEKVKVLMKRIERMKRRIREQRDEINELEQRAHTVAVVSSSTVECRRYEDIHVALLLVYSAGIVEVRCDEECYDCIYGHCRNT